MNAIESLLDVGFKLVISRDITGDYRALVTRDPDNAGNAMAELSGRGGTVDESLRAVAEKFRRLAN